MFREFDRYESPPPRNYENARYCRTRMDDYWKNQVSSNFIPPIDMKKALEISLRKEKIRNEKRRRDYIHRVGIDDINRSI